MNHFQPHRFACAAAIAVAALALPTGVASAQPLPTPQCTFSDHPLVAGQTTIKAVYLDELRQCVNALRAQRGLALASWTDPVIVPYQTVVKALYVTELRIALAQAFTQVGRPAPDFGPALVPTVTAIQATHFMALRTASLDLGNCTYQINPTGVTVGPGSSTGSVAVTTNPGCSWQALASASWIHITSGANGIGNGSVSYSVDDKGGTPARSGSIAIGGQTFSIQQTESSACMYTFDPPSHQASAAGGNSSVTVTTTVGCPVVATSEPSWIHVTSVPSGTGSGQVTYSVDPNPGAARTGTFLIDLRVPYSIQQSGATASPRFPLTLDDGVTVVFVDNYSSWSNTHVGTLVLKADRSTRSANMNQPLTPPLKGLLGSGDRIFVNNNYLAWFDFSVSSVPNPNDGSGSLSGFWTLNSATGTFKHLREVPSGMEWAHNELIRGAASPTGQPWWWDVYSAPIEHTISWPDPDGPGPLSPAGVHHHLSRAAPNNNGQWVYVGDGVPIAGEVHYKTVGRMAGRLPENPIQSQIFTDIVDKDDSNGVSNYFESELDYVCQETGIKVVWRLRPANANVQADLVYAWIWAHYSFDVDGAACSNFPAGADASPGQTYGEPAWYQSSMQSWIGAQSPEAAQTPLFLKRGLPCTQTPDPTVRYTFPVNAVADGDWVMWGEDSSLSPTKSRWTLTHVVDSSIGSPIPLNHLQVANEVTDGVWGGGPTKINPVFELGTWYSLVFKMSTQ